MSSDAVDSNLEYWSTRWTEQRIGWHQAKIDKYLVQFYPQITGKELPSSELPPPKDSQEFKANASKTWFVPLSGKTLDIPFLLGLGYSVFGVEGVRQAIETLDREQDLGLKFDPDESIFTGAEGRLVIYFGDLFQCPISKFGPFDYVWDRGSLIAIEYPLRDSYKAMLQRALKVKEQDEKYYNFVYLLEVVQYDKTKFGGPPRSIDEEDIQQIYEDWSVVKLLEKVALPPDHAVSKQPDIGPVNELIYLITPKN